MTYNSFEEYLTTCHYDAIYDSVNFFIDTNKNSLNIHTHLVPEIEETEIDGFKVKSVRYQDAPGDNIKFDLTVITDIVIKGGGEEDTNQKWLTVYSTSKDNHPNIPKAFNIVLSWSRNTELPYSTRFSYDWYVYVAASSDTL